MSGRRFSRADIPQSFPTLLGDATVAVVIAPHADVKLELLWELARSAAITRRVVVVDLCLRYPKLAEPGAPGITDAFLLGVSLADTVREIGADLYLISAGTSVDDPDGVWAHERWARLARGFRQEAALLMLFTPPEALGALPIEPDAVVALTAEDVATAVDAGMLLDRVLALQPDLPGRVTSASPRPSPPPNRARRSFIGRLSQPVGRMGTVMRPRERRGKAVAIAAAASLAIAFVVAAFVFWPSGAPEEPLAAAPASAPPPTTRALGDSLYYSVQVAAFQARTQAEAEARVYEDAGFTAVVSPVRLGRQGVWYRLLVGTESSPSAAQRQLGIAWDRGLAERPNGTILRTPHTLRVGRYPTRAAAVVAERALRQAGVAGYIVETSDGAQLLVGAFESPEQAALADSILAASGQPGTLVTRVGITR